MLKFQRYRLLLLGVILTASAVTVVVAIRKPGANVEELLRQGEMVADEHPQQAIELFDELLEHDPDITKALLYRGQLTAQQGDPDTAISYFQRIGNEPRREAGTARYLEAMAWYSKRYARKAEQQFLAAIAIHPTFLKPRESLVHLYYIQARPADLQQQLVSIGEVRSWNMEELFASQLCWFTSLYPQENIPILEGFVSADSDDVASRIALAQHYMVHDRMVQAIELLNDTKSLHPHNLTVHGLLAECHLELSDIQAAWRELEDDTPAAENPTLWWRALGHCAAEVDLWPETVSALRHAVAGNEKDYESAYLLGIAAERIGETDLAKQELERARTTEKLSSAASNLLKTSRDRLNLLGISILDIGRLLLELRRPLEAAPWLSTFLAMQPNHSEALLLWDRLRTLVADFQNKRPAEFDLKIVAKIGSAIEASGHDKLNTENLQAAQKTDQTAIRLRDIQQEIGLDFQYYNGESSNRYILETTGGGVAVFDYDADGWPDLFFPNGRELESPNSNASAFSDELYRNIGGERVERVTQLAGVSSSEYGQGCFAADYDNDGFQDLVVGNFGRILLYRNQGDGTFAEVAEEAGLTGSRWTSSLAMADFDRDGDLDLYLANYVKDPFLPCRDNKGRAMTCSPSNFHAEQDLLFLNNGDGHFRDVTGMTGILAPHGKGLGVVVADLDNDGWQDIYVANDGEQNFLFKNQTKRPDGELNFAEVGLVSGASVSRDGRAQAGMGIACDDFDHDGWLDLYVTNFYEDYNTLYCNQGGFLFSDETQSHLLAKPTMQVLGFGALSADLDLDGDSEIFVANGHIHDRRFEGTPWQMPPQCFARMSNGTYAEISEQVGPYFQGKYIGRGVARLDFNQDHLPDVVTVHQDRAVAVLLNETQQAGHALVLRLCGRQSNRDSIGSRIEFQSGLTRRVVEVTGGDGYCASNERTLIIGVGATNVVPQITIRWPSGHIDEFTDVPTDTSLLIVESRPPFVLATGQSQ